jgi:tetratricopeptide (TPR) repeat protein
MNKIQLTEENKAGIKEYIRTILIALLAALILAGIATGFSKILADRHAQMVEKISAAENDEELIGFLISKYLKETSAHPGDYSINVKLAKLYEFLNSDKQAEVQYKKAIDKTPYGVYSSYLGLANLYVRQGKYTEALKIVKGIKNTNHKPLLIAKGDFYINIGDAFFGKENYEAAVHQYKLALFFYKKADTSKNTNVINSILECYSRIADDNFKHNNIQEALKNLETALLYKESSLLNYKLAILYKDVDLIKANKYMEKTYVTDPGLINFAIYEEILIKLINYYDYIGQTIEKDLYFHKLKSVKNFQNRYALTEDGIKINIVSAKVKKNLFRTKKNIIVKFKIENTSKYDYNVLFLDVKLRGTDTRDIYKNKFFSKKEPLNSRKESTEYKFVYSIDKNDDMFVQSPLWLDFYTARKENMRKILVLTKELKKL